MREEGRPVRLEALARVWLVACATLLATARADASPACEGRDAQIVGQRPIAGALAAGARGQEAREGRETPGQPTKGGANAPAGATRAGASARSEAAAEELRQAAALHRAMQTPDPAERARARQDAIAAYRAVRAHFPADSAVCAEAAFRAGELLRAGGEVEPARAEFGIARELGARTPFRVRALLELGHLERRGASHPAALTAYEAVLGEPAASRGQRDEASLWIGRVHFEAGRNEDARRTWQRVADGAEDPLDRIRAWDALAGLSTSTGDLEGAAGAIERCREALAETAAEETRLGERVRNALSSMRAIDELARAVAARARDALRTTDGARGG